MNTRKSILILVLTLLNYGVSLVFFENRDLISEYLVINTLEIASIEQKIEWPGLYFYDGQPYTSQPGIQGFFFRLMLWTTLDPSSISYILIFFVSLLFNFFFVNCIYIIKNKFGKNSAILFSIPLFLSTFYWLDSGNLYWLYPLYIAPFYLSISKTNIYSDKKLCFTLFFTFLAKFCTGFEYVPVIIISAIIPTIILQTRKIDFCTTLKKTMMIGLTGTLAFTTAVLLLVSNEIKVKKTNSSLINVIQSYLATEKNSPHFLNYENKISTTIEQYKILNKTIDPTDSHMNGWTSVLKARDTYLGYSSLKDYFSFSTKKSQFYSIQATTAIFLVITLAFLARTHIEIVNLVLAALVSALAAAVWIILMPLHFYLHSVYWRGLSDIIFVFPFYSVVGLTLGFYLNTKIDTFYFNKKY